MYKRQALHLTWSEDTKSTQTITWQMHEFNPNIRVEYGEIGLPADFPKKVMADVEPFPDETGVSHVYHVTLQGLKSNKEYFYRIVDGDITIKEANFKMGKNLDSCDFLVFGDSQSYNYKVWGETLKAAYTQNPNAEFFVNVGDLVDNGQRISEWENWFLNGKDIMIHLPIVPVVGNHETYTPQKGKMCIRDRWYAAYVTIIICLFCIAVFWDKITGFRIGTFGVYVKLWCLFC